MDTWKKHVVSGGGWLLLGLAVAGYCQSFLAYHFFYQEQFYMFRFSKEYAVDTLWQVGGVTAYLAAFVVQFFLIPFVGPLVMGLSVVVLGWLMKNVWRKIAVSCSLPLLYLLPGICTVWACMDFNYHFDGLLSLLLALVCLNGYLRIGSFRWRMVYGAVTAWVGYLLAGPHLLLAVIAAVLWEVCCGKSRWKGGSLLMLPWGFGLPLLLYGLGWGGEWRLLATPDAYYHPLLLSQKVNYLPGILVLLNVLAACILHRNRKSLSGWRLWTSWGIQICLLAGIFHQGIRHYSNDRNYEIKVLDYYSRTGQWQQILDYPGLRAGQNAMHACYQNLALSHLGKLGDELFRYPQCGRWGAVISWNKTVNASMLLSDVYYQMGNLALSQEMAFEGMIASERAVNPRLLLRLVQTNLIGGHDAVAEKYISLLEETCMYAEQAGAYRRFLHHPELLRQDAELGPRQACVQHASGLTNAQKAAVDLFQVVRSNPEYQPAFQYFGAICLLCKDLKSFGELMEYWKQAGSVCPLPVAFQEAWVFMHAGEPELWAAYGVSEAVAGRFKEYGVLVSAGRQDHSLAYRLQNHFGDTFWFYYMFTK